MASTRASLSGMALQREADILYSSIENFMLVGEAPVAVKFFRETTDGAAKSMFLASIAWLPAIVVLLLADRVSGG